MLKFIKWLFLAIIALIFVLVIVYLLGPKSDAPEFQTEIVIPVLGLNDVDDFIAQKEKLAGKIKKDNEARVIWQDSTPQKTPYSVVYLHGFGASQGEGDPVHKNIADSLGANLYLSRLAGHGLEKKDAFVGLTPESYMKTAMEAFAVGQVIGDSLILMATSTGASQALYLAARFPDKIAALVLYSPFIEMADQNLQKLSIGPWHEVITQAMIGNEISYTERADSVAAYWSEYYHLDAYTSLFSMVHYSTTPEVLKQVKVPVFLGYYYKDEANQDDVVSVDAMLEMFELLAVPQKKKIGFPETGDHVIASRWRSNNWRAVQDSSWYFLKTNLKL